MNMKPIHGKILRISIKDEQEEVSFFEEYQSTLTISQAHTHGAGATAVDKSLHSGLKTWRIQSRLKMSAEAFTLLFSIIKNRKSVIIHFGDVASDGTHLKMFYGGLAFPVSLTVESMKNAIVKMNIVWQGTGPLSKL